MRVKAPFRVQVSYASKRGGPVRVHWNLLCLHWPRRRPYIDEYEYEARIHQHTQERKER